MNQIILMPAAQFRAVAQMVETDPDSWPAHIELCDGLEDEQGDPPIKDGDLYVKQGDSRAIVSEDGVDIRILTP